MATIIDALVMTLGLDASDYLKNSQKVKKENQAFTEEQKKQVDKIEKQTKRALGAISTVQKGILGLFTTIAGSSGVSQFLTQVNSTEAALGRLSTHTGQSTQDLHKWGNVAELVGGKAEDMQAGMSSLQQQLTDLKYKGEMGPAVMFLAQMGVAVATTNGEMRKQNDIMLDLADQAKNMSKEDFYNLASGAGFTDSQILAMSKGRSELSKLLAEQEKNALVTKEQAAQAQALNAQWAGMKHSFFSLGVRTLSDIAPAIEYILNLLGKLFDFIQQNREIAYVGFGGFAVAMAPAIISVIRFIGLLTKGWMPVFRLIFRMSGLLLNILRGILVVIAGISAPVLAVVAAIAALAGAIYLLWDDWKAWRDGGDSFINWGSWSKEIDWAVEGITRLIQSLGKLGGAVDAIKNGDFKGAWNIIKSTVVDSFNDKPPEKDVTPPQKTAAESKATSEIREQATKIAKAAETTLKAGAAVAVGTAKMAAEVNQGIQTSSGKHLGWLSAKYEGKIGSANRDIDQNGNPAGWAYGKYQFNSAKGGLQKFFSDNPGIAKQFNGLKPETNAFAKKWKELAKKDPKGFELAQDKSAANLWFKPASNAYSKAGFNLGNEGVREAVFSSSIQHGGVVRKLLPLAKKMADKEISQLSNKEQIELIYKARMKYHPNGKKRYENELNSALGVAGNNDQFTSGVAGARAQAAIGSLKSKSSISNVETSIGEINIYTAATDTKGIVSEIGPALNNAFQFNTHYSDSGLT